MTKREDDDQAGADGEIADGHGEVGAAADAVGVRGRQASSIGNGADAGDRHEPHRRLRSVSRLRR